MRAQASQAAVTIERRPSHRAEEILEHVPSPDSLRPTQPQIVYRHRHTGAVLPANVALALNPDLVIQP